ncbi:MAG: hydrolase 2, exosortase A system-associated [Gammaproteobacteria bacterium]
MSEIEPLFIDGASGPLFCVHHHPDTPTGRGVLMLPGFAEEMNKSRHIFSESARAMASAGLDVLMLDPWGTGDSGGDHGEATWTRWLDDVDRASRYLRASGVDALGLMGLRTGALLAADSAAACGAAWLLFWQPVTAGRLFLQQFLRLRLAAAMATGAGKGGESLKDLKAALANGQTLEIAGYGLHPEMAAALDEARLSTPSGTPVLWFELPAQPTDEMPPARQRPMDELREAGVPLEVRQLICDPFWSTVEIAHCPDLVAATATAAAALAASKPVEGAAP